MHGHMNVKKSLRYHYSENLSHPNTPLRYLHHFYRFPPFVNASSITLISATQLPTIPNTNVADTWTCGADVILGHLIQSSLCNFTTLSVACEKVDVCFMPFWTLWWTEVNCHFHSAVALAQAEGYAVSFGEDVTWVAKSVWNLSRKGNSLSERSGWLTLPRHCLATFKTTVSFFILTSVYLLILGADGSCCSWSHSMTPNRKDSSGQGIGPPQRYLPDNTQHSQERGIHVSWEIRTHNPSKRVAADPCLRGPTHVRFYLQF